MKRVEVLFDASGATVVIDANHKQVAKAIIHILAAISEGYGDDSADIIFNEVLEHQEQKKKRVKEHVSLDEFMDKFRVFNSGGFTSGRQNGNGFASIIFRNLHLELTEENKINAKKLKDRFDQTAKKDKVVLSTTEVIQKIVDILKENQYYAYHDYKSVEPLGPAVNICNAIIQTMIADSDKKQS